MDRLGRSNLTGETLQHFALPAETVGYAWTYADSTSGNFDRLTGMTYPTGGPDLTLGYDSVGTANYALSRIASITDGALSLGTLATYDYTGSGRRYLVWDPNDPNYPYDPNDPNTWPQIHVPPTQGRITTGATPGATLYEFAYDGLGRLATAVDHRGASTVTTHYTYDGVRRIMEQSTPSGGPTTTRYYVYGPGYVDEVIAQVETRSDFPGVAESTVAATRSASATSRAAAPGRTAAAAGSCRPGRPWSRPAGSGRCSADRTGWRRSGRRRTVRCRRLC